MARRGSERHTSGSSHRPTQHGNHKNPFDAQEASFLSPPPPMVPPPEELINPEGLPNTASSAPQIEHESCARRFAELEERVGRLELESAERNMLVLDTAEKVSERLRERVRKRKDNEAAPMDEIDRLIAIRRGAYGLHDR